MLFHRILLFICCITTVFASTPQQAKTSTVGIYVEYPQAPGANMPSQAFGSGIIVSEDGYIVTNHHVVQQAQSIMVRTHDGQKSFAKVIGAAPEFDLSVFNVEVIILRIELFK